MMKNIVYLLLYLCLSIELNAQPISSDTNGKISFVSSQNVYVKFKSTEGILPGDTLFISIGGKNEPVLIVKNLSSSSTVCTSISSVTLSVSQEVIRIIRKKELKPEEKITSTSEPLVPPQIVLVDTSKSLSSQKVANNKTDGSISVYSYSDFSNTAAKNSTTMRYTLRLNASHIGNSKFSLENYITFRHKTGNWAMVKDDLFSALKIYNFALKFEPGSKTKISVGRSYNQRIASLGSIDGLQAEHAFGNISIGVLAGSRPDYLNYGYNSKLLQYGGYVAFGTKSGAKFIESSLAFMQQMNNLKTDRRFFYLQHSNSLLKNLVYFGTIEVDLYSLKNGLPQNAFNLTSIYSSLRFRISKNFTLTGSYDQRKNIVFYETYKSLIDSVFETEKRQSFRLHVNYRITKSMSAGLESGYRFMKSDPRPSRNLYGYITYYQIPGIKSSLTLSGTYLESAYMDGMVLSTNLTTDFFHGRVQTQFGYRYVEYILSESRLSLLQNIGEFGIFWQFSRKMTFSANYEGTFEKNNKYSRIYLQIRKRF